MGITKKTVLAVMCFCGFFGLVMPLLAGSLAVYLTGLLFRDKIISRAGFNMLLSVDQFGNAVLLGDPDETISSRTGRAIMSDHPNWVAVVMQRLVDKMFHILLGERNHCINAVESNCRYEKEIWNWINRE